MVENNPNAFNLVTEGWIPVLKHDGEVKRVGILEALTTAAEIRQIAASNPMDRVAVIRFLLAVLYWCKGNPQVTKTPASCFQREDFRKLLEDQTSFDLLGDGKRFYQFHPISPKGNESKHEVISLLQEIPNGDDKWHFRHSTDFLDGSCRPCCALGLLRLPVYISGEGRGWHQGINGTPPIYVLPVGDSLYDTLILNWKNADHIGEPSWTSSRFQLAKGANVPLLEGLTQLSRKVWFHEPADNGYCICCGARNVKIIRTCEYQSSGEIEKDGWVDPHVCYLEKTEKRNRKGIAAENLTKVLSSDRPINFLLQSMLNSDFGKNRKFPRLLIVGFTTKQATNVDVWERYLQWNVPPESSRLDSASALSRWQNESYKLARRASGRKKHKEYGALINSIRPHVEHVVSSRIIELLSGKPESWEKAALEYRPMMRVVAGALASGSTTKALRQRQLIGNTIPDMRFRPESEPKPARKKGGKK